MTEIRISPDGQVAQRLPFDKEDGCNWLCWIFLDTWINTQLRSDAEVADWEIVWPRREDQ